MSESKSHSNEAKYTVEIINNKNQFILKAITELHNYQNGSDSSYERFMRRDPMTQHLLPNTELKLCYEVDFFDCIQNTCIENKVINDLQKLVNNNKYSDFVFIVHNKQFFAHKNIIHLFESI